MVFKVAKKVLIVMSVAFFFGSCKVNKTSSKKFSHEFLPFKGEKNNGRLRFDIVWLDESVIRFKFRNKSDDTLLAVLCSKDVFYLKCSEEISYPENSRITGRNDSLRWFLTKSVSETIVDTNEAALRIEQIFPLDSIEFNVKLREEMAERIWDLNQFQLVIPPKYLSYANGTMLNKNLSFIQDSIVSNCLNISDLKSR